MMKEQEITPTPADKRRQNRIEADGQALDYHSRKFLNPEKGRAVIEVIMETSAYFGNNTRNNADRWAIGDRSISIELSVSDCNRVVTLDFFGNDEENLYKLNMLIRELNRLRKAALVGIEWAREGVVDDDD